jgi:polysaccharide biosynthesis/export protein
MADLTSFLSSPIFPRRCSAGRLRRFAYGIQPDDLQFARHDMRPRRARHMLTAWSMTVARLCLATLICYAATAVAAQSVSHAREPSQGREVLGPGDSVRITVFQNPDLTTETRVSDRGSIVFPLVGEVKLNGLTVAEAGSRIADLLKRGNFIINPQVTFAVLQVRSRLVYVLGEVVRPGTYPLEENGTRLTDILTLAGGVSASGGNTVTVVLTRGGKSEKREIDVPAMFRSGNLSENIEIENGDTLYVQRAPVFYIYGEVQHAGVYRLETNMVVMQALSLGGGLTARGSEKKISIQRRLANGKFARLEARLTDPINVDDIIYVSESLF